MLVVVAHIPGALGGFLYNTYVTQALDKSLSDRGVGRTHIWYIMAIDCNAFLTPDENIRLA